MSLFDILRYRGIDLGSRSELETLPEDLITQYWLLAHKTFPERDIPSHSVMCRQLANWGKVDDKENHYARGLFDRVLKEYNP